MAVAKKFARLVLMRIKKCARNEMLEIARAMRARKFVTVIRPIARAVNSDKHISQGKKSIVGNHLCSCENCLKNIKVQIMRPLENLIKG